MLDFIEYKTKQAIVHIIWLKPMNLWALLYLIIVFYRPPAGCLQFFTGLSGMITSFNGARMGDAHQMIQNQQYRVCIKRGAGMNQIYH